jgi:hypothetical protein
VLHTYNLSTWSHCIARPCIKQNKENKRKRKKKKEVGRRKKKRKESKEFWLLYHWLKMGMATE